MILQAPYAVNTILISDLSYCTICTVQSHCLNGHPYPESLRTSGHGCAVCGRERMTAKRRANGVSPRGPAGTNWSCDHDPKVTMRPGRTDCSICHREKARIYYQEHPERVKAAVTAWADANPEKVRANKAAWRAVNRVRTNVSDRLRRSDASLQETKDWVKIIVNDPCSYCGNQFEHVDHITALSQNGDGTWDNLTAACSACNLSKQAKSLLEFLLGRSSRRSRTETGRSTRRESTLAR